MSRRTGFTRDRDRALRVGDRLRTGMVGLNTGGIEEYLDVKYLALALKE